MRRSLILPILFVCAFTGCATFETIDTTDTSSVREQVEVGDRVTVSTVDFRRYELRLTSVSETAIEGEDSEGMTVSVAYDDISTLTLREPRPGRTAAAVTGGIVGTAAALYVAAIVAAAMLLGAML